MGKNKTNGKGLVRVTHKQDMEDFKAFLRNYPQQAKELIAEVERGQTADEFVQDARESIEEVKALFLRGYVSSSDLKRITGTLTSIVNAGNQEQYEDIQGDEMEETF